MKRLIFLSLFAAACSSSNDPAPVTPPLTGIRDGDKNLYVSVTIGAQTWLTSDLKTRHYMDGSAVVGLYGPYYKWDALSDSKGLCPNGYRIGRLQDFQSLLAHYSGDAAPLLDDFKPGIGGYYDVTGTFQSIPDHYFYWTTTEIPPSAAYNFMISTLDPSLEGTADKEQGFCVRCIKK